MIAGRKASTNRVMTTREVMATPRAAPAAFTDGSVALRTCHGQRICLDRHSPIHAYPVVAQLHLASIAYLRASFLPAFPAWLNSVNTDGVVRATASEAFDYVIQISWM